jgi:hypothetical protein
LVYLEHEERWGGARELSAEVVIDIVGLRGMQIKKFISTQQ